MAILEFGTGEGSTGEEQSATRKSSRRAVEGDGGTTIPSLLASLGHGLERAMLDAEDVGERRGEPAFSDTRGEPLVVRRIREGDVVCVGVELLDEREGIGAMHRRCVAC